MKALLQNQFHAFANHRSVQTKQKRRAMHALDRAMRNRRKVVIDQRV